MKISIMSLLSIGLLLSSCSPGSDKITGSSSLSNQIAGKYSRNYNKNFGSYSNDIKDTIEILKKDDNFEVQNHRWFISSNDKAGGYTQTGGFGSFQAKYNKTDTSIANPLGGSLKFDLSHNSLYLTQNQSEFYLKIK